MPADIGQGFLKDAEDGCCMLPAQISGVYKGIELADDSGAGFKLLRLLFDGCH
jgi:hypothetical protein